MKKLNLTAILILAGLVTAGSAFADTLHEVRVNVPFSFVVGNKTLPAGHYRIDAESTNMIMIRNSNHPRFAVLAETSGDPLGWAIPRWPTHASVVFNQYGGEHYLRVVRGPIGAVNVNLPMSPAERQAKLRAKAEREQR